MDKIKGWWRETTGGESMPLDGESGAWLLSMMVHVGVLVALAMLTLLIPQNDTLLLTTSPTEIPEELLPETFEVAEFSPDEIGALSEAGSASAEAMAPTESDISEVLQDLPPVMLVSDLQAMEVEQPIMQGPNFSETLFVKGSGNVGTTGAAGAVDRITNEVLLALEQRPTLVVWLFDQSGSLTSQRAEIADRFDRIYEELGVFEAAKNPAFAKHDDKPLLTSVASFGGSVNLLTEEPTDNVAAIKSKVRSIKDDDAGVENVFAAVTFLANKYRDYRTKEPRRNVLLVVFTDEAGNDTGNLDTAVATCRKYEMPVFVVGVPAPFGRQEAMVKYVDPDPNYDQTPQWVAVDQGPESLYPERIKLGFLGQGTEDERIDSGFGPFGLSRLTYETGGMYFSVHPDRGLGRQVSRGQTTAMATHIAQFFDPAIMRMYRPDYITIQEYQSRAAKNKARVALVQASQMSWTMPMEDVRLNFPKIDEARFSEDLSRAQRAAAKLEPRLIQLVNVLQQGEADREKEITLRWQAGYDLALGRALATKVRTEGYNTMLALAKQGLKFEDEKNDTWVLKPSDEISSGSVLSKEADMARMYLERVVANHEGTPWAMLAAKELATPFGWKWTEEFNNLVAREQMAGNGNNNPRPMMNVPPKKPTRPAPKL